MSTSSPDFLRIIQALPDVGTAQGSTWTSFKVREHTFGYLWEATQTVGLKQTLSEQRALVAERPEVFEVQFTTMSFGWVVVQLGGIELDELCELTFESWRLTAPAELAEAFGDRPPVIRRGPRRSRSTPGRRRPGEPDQQAQRQNG